MLKRSLVLVVAVIGLLASRSFAASVGPILWIDDSQGNIGTVNVHTGAATVIGNAGVVLTDIAFDPSGNLWGLSYTDLYRVSKTTGLATLVGSLGIPSANALTFDEAGTLYAAGSGSTGLYSVNTASGAATSLGNIGFDSAGDLAFNDGTLYMSDTNNELVRIKLSGGVSGAEVGPIGFSNVLGMATGNDGVLYGVAGTDIFSIDTSTGLGTLTADYAGQGLSDAYGTAFVNETISGGSGSQAVPLPPALWTSLAMLGGLAVCGVIRGWLRPA